MTVPENTTAAGHDADTTQATDVVMVGGGIGGLGAALMLAQSGLKVAVLERAEEFGEVGAGLQLAPNITRMLDQVGVLERILPYAVRPRRLVFRNAVNGNELTHLDLADAADRYGGPYLVLHRSDLLNALKEACEEQEGISLHVNSMVTEVAQDEDSATATTSDGRTFTGRILVGSDGLRSVVREVISDDEAVGSGYVAYRGAVPVEDATSHMGDDDVVIWLGPGLHLVQYPVRAGKLYNQVAVFESQELKDGKEDWGTPEELDATYDPMCEPVREAIPALGRINRWPMFDRVPIRTWTDGRITLLGDAAHAMLQYLAQGAGQSLLDGDALTRALIPLKDGNWSRDDVGKALSQYEDERVEAAGATQTVGRVWGDMWHVRDDAARYLRDQAFSNREITDYTFVDWLYGPVVGETSRPKAPLPPAYAD